MFLKRLSSGMLASNCYIAGNNGEGAVIDPGAPLVDIMDIIKEQQLSIKYIFLTHSHLDHIISIDELRNETGAKVILHENEAGYLTNSWYNGSNLFGLDKTFNEADIFTKDADLLGFGGLTFEILHTPGHSPGSICIKTEDIVFTGDTLFKLSIGRSDLGNGNAFDLIKSIKTKLFTLDDSTKVYPGHYSSTSISYEKNNNPYLR